MSYMITWDDGGLQTVVCHASEVAAVLAELLGDDLPKVTVELVN